MKRTEYLSDPRVRGFIGWVCPRLCTPGSFIHEWVSPRGGPWSCSSLYDAYLNYRWPDTRNPGTFSRNEAELDDLGSDLRRAYSDRDEARLTRVAEGVLGWGAVAGSRHRLSAFYDQLPAALSKLNPRSADLDDVAGVLMNATFTKLYHLLLDDFPIYDGRVGAALGFLARLYLHDEGISRVPPMLTFAWGAARQRIATRTPNRNPSEGGLRFPQLAANPELHSRCNLMAAWLLRELGDHDCFGRLPSARRGRTLEAALFMVGYDLG